MPDDLLLSQSNRCVVWDSKNDCYALCRGETVIYTPAEKSGEGEALWKFVSMIPEYSKLSVYGCESYRDAETVTYPGGQPRKG